MDAEIETETETDSEVLRIIIAHVKPQVIDQLIRLLPMYHVSRATSLAEAMELIENQNFDFVILNGVRTRLILELAEKRRISALVLTCNTQNPEHGETAMRAKVTCVPESKIEELPYIVARPLAPKNTDKGTRPRWLSRFPLFSQNGSDPKAAKKTDGFWDTHSFLRSRYLEWNDSLAVSNRQSCPFKASFPRSNMVNHPILT